MTMGWVKKPTCGLTISLMDGLVIRISVSERSFTKYHLLHRDADNLETKNSTCRTAACTSGSESIGCYGASLATGFPAGHFPLLEVGDG
jgi:hypothetical protein